MNKIANTSYFKIIHTYKNHGIEIDQEILVDLGHVIDWDYLDAFYSPSLKTMGPLNFTSSLLNSSCSAACAFFIFFSSVS